MAGIGGGIWQLFPSTLGPTPWQFVAEGQTHLFNGPGHWLSIVQGPQAVSPALQPKAAVEQAYVGVGRVVGATQPTWLALHARDAFEHAYVRFPLHAVAASGWQLVLSWVPAVPVQGEPAGHCV